jgi:drug/metabolite transporter (DMT)-like permease
MGYLFLLLSKLSGIGKMVAMKKCGNIASGAESSLIINLLRSSGCLVISLVVSLSIGFGGMNGVGWLIAVIFGIAQAFFLFSWVLAAERASLCTVEIFCMIGGVLVPLLVTPLFIPTETVGTLAWIGAFLLLPAAVLSFPKNRGKSLSLSAFPLLLFAGGSNAACVVAQKLYTEYGEGSAADFNLAAFAVTIPTLALIYAVIRVAKIGTKREAFPLKSGNTQIIVYIMIAIIMLYCAQYTNTLASGSLEASVLFPLSYAIGMPLTMLTDVVVFREKVKIRTLCGVLLAVVSAILCNV